MQHRPAACHRRRSTAEPCPPWLIVSSVINILPLKAQVKHWVTPSPPRHYPLKFEIAFCVRGVNSPILMNLFMHYTFDAWMKRRNPLCPFARYADDAVVHCRNQKQAEDVMQSIALRLAECGLTMHPEKSKIVYCKDSNRTESSPHVYFTFLRFTFRPRKALSKQNRLFTSFLPGVSADALKRMRQTVRGWKLNR